MCQVPGLHGRLHDILLYGTLLSDAWLIGGLPTIYVIRTLSSSAGGAYT